LFLKFLFVFKISILSIKNYNFYTFKDSSIDKKSSIESSYNTIPSFPKCGLKYRIIFYQ